MLFTFLLIQMLFLLGLIEARRLLVQSEKLSYPLATAMVAALMVCFSLALGWCYPYVLHWFSSI